MTQEELREKVEIIVDESEEGTRVNSSTIWVNDTIGRIMDLINQHVKDVIGEDEKPDYRYFDGGNEFIHDRNHVRAEQRKRAELTK